MMHNLAIASSTMGAQKNNSTTTAPTMAATTKTPATTQTSPTKMAAWTMAAHCRQQKTNARETRERGANREVMREGKRPQPTKTKRRLKTVAEACATKLPGIAIAAGMTKPPAGKVRADNKGCRKRSIPSLDVIV